MGNTGLSYFIRMLGPALGYTLASMCLKLYISPSLQPTITNSDPRWLGAWWLGWVILAIIMSLSALLIAMFPKTLPRAAVRRVIHQERIRRELSIVQPKEEEASLKGLFALIGIKDVHYVIEKKIIFLTQTCLWHSNDCSRTVHSWWTTFHHYSICLVIYPIGRSRRSTLKRSSGNLPQYPGVYPIVLSFIAIHEIKLLNVMTICLKFPPVW